MPIGDAAWLDRIRNLAGTGALGFNDATGGTSSASIGSRLRGANSLLTTAGPGGGLPSWMQPAAPPAPAPYGGMPGLAAGGSMQGPAMPPPPTGAAAMLGRLGGGAANPSYLSQRLAGQSTAGLGVRSLAKGSLGRAGLMGMGGQLAGGAIDSAFGDPNESWDNMLASGARWGGAGAALGSMVAPGIGTAIGGAAGLGIGAIKGLVDSRNEGDNAVASELGKQQSKITELLSQLGSSPDLREQALFQLQMDTSGAGTKDQVRDAAKALQAMLPDAIMADRQQQEQKRMQQANQAAAQAWMGPMLQQQVDRSQFYADQFAQAGRSAASHITDPALQASQMAMASGISAEQAAMNAAYTQQIAAAPNYYGYQQDLLSQLQQAQQQLQSTPQGMDMFEQIMAQQGM